MNITSWELYWILQLDQVRSVFGVICFFSSLAFAILWLILLFTSDLDDYKMDAGMKRNLKKTCVCTGVISAFSILLLVFMPTTRQLLAVKVMPIITNTDFVQKELPEEDRELYGLLKQYLRANINKEVEK